MSIFDDKIEIISKSNDALRSGAEKIDNLLIKEIIKIYASFKIGEQLVFDPQKAAELENQIIAIIKNSNYKDFLKSYLSDFGAIDDINKLIHERINKINITAVINKNERIVNFRKLIEDSLSGTNKLRQRASQLDQLISPLTTQIRKDLILGVTFKQATDAIEQAIKDKDLGLSQWSEQIARDALNQYDGIQDQEIRNEFKLEWGNYIGGVSKNTRPLCFHMHVVHPSFKWSEIQDILDPFVKDGIPNQSYTTLTGKKQKKGAGIIPGTVASNFDVRRGGYNCRHNITSSRFPIEN